MTLFNCIKLWSWIVTSFLCVNIGFFSDQVCTIWTKFLQRIPLLTLVSLPENVFLNFVWVHAEWLKANLGTNFSRNPSGRILQVVKWFPSTADVNKLLTIENVGFSFCLLIIMKLNYVPDLYKQNRFYL